MTSWEFGDFAKIGPALRFTDAIIGSWRFDNCCWKCVLLRFPKNMNFGCEDCWQTNQPLIALFRGRFWWFLGILFLSFRWINFNLQCPILAKFGLPFLSMFVLKSAFSCPILVVVWVIIRVVELSWFISGIGSFLGSIFRWLFCWLFWWFWENGY